MIAEYNVNLENKTKSELILFIKELQDMLKEKDAEIEKKDKIITLLAKAFKQDDVRTVEEIKQYFEELAERKSEQ